MIEEVIDHLDNGMGSFLFFGQGCVHELRCLGYPLGIVENDYFM